MLAIKLTDDRTSRSIGHTRTVDAPRCHTLRQFVHSRVNIHMLQSLTVRLCSMLRLCSMRLCSKLLGGRGLTRAAFYQISTDSVLARSLSGSWTSCLASLRPFIEILRSLVVYVNHHNKYYLRKTPCEYLCGDDAVFDKLF